MKKLFISQPMNGKTNEDILNERNTAIESAKKLLSDDVEVIDSFFRDVPTNAKPLCFLGKAIELLSTADIAYFAPGWRSARGCIIEHQCAVNYGVPIICAEDTAEV